ncbi:hypothetical protein [Cohnella sp. GCM10027633]
MKAIYHCIELHGTPKEIAEAVAQIRDIKYGKEAQKAMFDRQEGQVRP